MKLGWVLLGFRALIPKPQTINNNPKPHVNPKPQNLNPKGFSFVLGGPFSVHNSIKACLPYLLLPAS